MKIKFYRSCKVILFFIFFTTKSFSQESFNPSTVDEKSYQLFMEKNWHELIRYGNLAVKNGYNYFYMQMRIAIAYYEIENFNLAEKHFKNALHFNLEDELAQEYLYYCYTHTGRYEQARLLSKNFSNELGEKIGTAKKSDIDFIMAEGGTKIADSSNYYNTYTKQQSNFFNPATYFQVGLNHTIKNTVSVFHAATIFNQQSYPGFVNQNQYYLKVSIPTNNNWLINTSIHFVNLNYTASLFQGKKNSTTKSNYFVGSISAQKIINRFTFSAGTTLSNINKTTQYNSGFLTYSFFGNNKLIIGCSGYFITSDNYKTKNTAIIPFIYIQPINKLSVKVNYMLNKNENIIEDNGYLINNSSDLTKSKLSILSSFYFNKNFSMYGLYQLENKEESFQLFNYKYNVIIFGIKYSFN